METSVVQTFFNDDFGEFRTLNIEGENWAVAADACRILEIKNPRDAIANFDDDEKGVAIIYTLGGPQKMNIINEAGLYRLIFMSRKPNAKKFQRWAFHEVFPQIRKTGSYSIYGNNFFPPELSERWTKIKERENEVKAADVLAKAARLTSSSKFREHLLKQAHSMITSTEFIEENCSIDFSDDL